jgi:hypothetical protein
MPHFFKITNITTFGRDVESLAVGTPYVEWGILSQPKAQELKHKQESSPINTPMTKNIKE